MLVGSMRVATRQEDCPFGLRNASFCSIAEEARHVAYQEGPNCSARERKRLSESQPLIYRELSFCACNCRSSAAGVRRKSGGSEDRRPTHWRQRARRQELV